MFADRRGRMTLISTAVALSGVMVLGGCGDDATGPPKGWRTLSVGQVRVDYPDRFITGEKVTGTDGAVVAEIEHVFLSAVSVYLESVDPQRLDERFGATRVSTPRAVDVEGARSARRVSYRLDAIEKDHAPVKGTVTTGILITGVGSGGEGFAVRVDGVKGTLSAEERERIADSVRWED